MDNSNIENYKGYMIEFIENRGDYRVYDPVHPEQTIAYEDSLEAARTGIDEQLTPKELVLSDAFGRTDTFAVVDSFPDSRYVIWNIGDNMLDGYLPLCRLSPDRPDPDILEVDTNSLVAIDMSDKPETLYRLRHAAGVGINSLESAQKHIHLSEYPSELEKEQHEIAMDLLTVFEEMSPFASRDIELSYAENNLGSRNRDKLFRLDVPKEVIDSVKEYLDTNFKNTANHPQYELAYIGRSSDHPDDKNLYQVIAKKWPNTFDCWTCWNQSTKSLNHGHYGFDNYLDAKSVLNDYFYISIYQGRGLEVPDEVKARMQFEDNYVDYCHDEFSDSYMESYMKITEAWVYGDLGLAFTTLGDEDIPIQVSVNLADKVFYTDIGGAICEYNQYDSFAEMLENIPFNFDDLTCFDENDVDFCLTGSYLADCYKMITEGARPDGNQFFEMLHNYMSAQEIFQKPADIVDVIAAVSSKEPELKPLCEKFKDLVDKYIDMKYNDVPYGVYHEAKELSNKCKQHLGIETEPREQDNGESR